MPDGFIPQGSEFQVNTETAFSQYQPAIAALTDGGFVVTWASTDQDGDGSGVYGQRYDADGAAVGAEFLVNTYTTDDQRSPTITALADGGFVVTWESGSGHDGSSGGVFGQRYDATGATVGDEFQVNTYTTSTQYFPSITALADGGFVVTWSSYLQDGDGFGIYGQRYDADGAAVGDEFQVNTETDNWQVTPSVTALADGGFVVTWTSYVLDSASIGVFGQRYGNDGVTVGNEFQVNTETAGYELESSVTGLADGGFVVTWMSYGPDGSGSGVYGQRYAADGVTVGDEFQINTYTTEDQSNPAITALADGGFVVTWQSDTQDGDAYGIYGQRYAADGASVGNEFLVNATTADWQYRPSITALADGGFVVTWGYRNQAGDDNDIFAQQFAAQTFGTLADDEMFGTASDDWIDGLGGDDILKGQKGADILYGEDGQDSLKGGKGADMLYGGNGADILKGSKGQDSLEGGAGKDKLYGGKGADTLQGGEGKDTLYGDNGADTLQGGAGKDTLYGGKGDDILEGGAGKDQLFGGEGADVFVFSANEDRDIIRDFQDGTDKIDLSAFGFLLKAEALLHFLEIGSAKNDVVGFVYEGTAIRIHGLDLGDINGADIII